VSANEPPPTHGLKVGTMYRVRDVRTAWATPGSIVECVSIYNEDMSPDFAACTARVLFGTITDAPKDERLPEGYTRFINKELEPLNALE